MMGVKIFKKKFVFSGFVVLFFASFVMAGNEGPFFLETQQGSSSRTHERDEKASLPLKLRFKKRPITELIEENTAKKKTHVLCDVTPRFLNEPVKSLKHVLDLPVELLDNEAVPK